MPVANRGDLSGVTAQRSPLAAVVIGPGPALLGLDDEVIPVLLDDTLPRHLGQQHWHSLPQAGAVTVEIAHKQVGDVCRRRAYSGVGRALSRQQRDQLQRGEDAGSQRAVGAQFSLLGDQQLHVARQLACSVHVRALLPIQEVRLDHRADRLGRDVTVGFMHDAELGSQLPGPAALVGGAEDRIPEPTPGR